MLKRLKLSAIFNILAIFRSKSTYTGEKFRVVAVNEQPTLNRTVSHVKEVHVEIGDNFKLSFSKGAVVKVF